MTTKNDNLFIKDPSFVNDNADNDNQYSNLNLKQNRQCSKISPIHSNSKSYNNKSFVSENYEKKRKSHSLNKFSKTSNFVTLNTEVEESTNEWKKTGTSNAISNSTLSFHISSYENSVDLENDIENIQKEELKKKKSFIIDTLFFNGSPTFIQNQFEFTRQHENEESKEPEVGQFKASQTLLNPNKTKKIRMSKTNKQMPLDDDEVDAEVMVPNSNKVSNEIVKQHDKTDEIFMTAEEKDKYMEKWLEVAYLIYSTLIENKQNAENTIICVPQIISTLELFAQASSCDKDIQKYIYFVKSPTVLNKKNMLGKILEKWEKDVQDAAKPGNFYTQRRLFVNHGFSKSYSLETFATLSMLGIEVKILFNENSDFLRWLKNSCKMKQFPDSIRNPFNLWPIKDYSVQVEKKDHKEMNICKCPIFVAVSQFEFPIKANALDNEKVYKIVFRTPTSRTEVLAFRIKCTKLNPLRFIQISQKCRIIELPCAAERLSTYIIENCDEIDIKNGKDLKQYILSMNNAQTDTEIESLYIPRFFGFSRTSSNIAQGIQDSLKDTHKLFQANAFADLAYEGAEPSASKPSSIQHYNHFELMKLPDCTKSNITSVKHDERHHKIAQPFMFIVWDINSKIPLYISRICAPDRDDESNDGSAKDKDKVLQPKNKWNVFASFFGLFKKKPIVKKELETVDIPATITQSQKLDP